MGDSYISSAVHIYPRKHAPIDAASFFRPDTYDTCQMSKVAGAVDRTDDKFADLRLNAICEFNFSRLPNNLATIISVRQYSQ